MNELRFEKSFKQLVFLAEACLFSKKIMQFGTHTGGSEGGEGGRRGPSPKEVMVQRNIRSFAGAFLSEMVLSVPNLPSEEEYASLQREHKRRLRQQIDAEREAAQMAVKRVSAPHILTFPPPLVT